MHQPLYRDIDGAATLPWVRLHAAKDYLHMAELLGEFPRMHATVNFVPSLVEQIAAYVDGAEDRWERLSRQATFSAADRAFVLEAFFSASWDRVIRAQSAYWRLLQIRNHAEGRHALLSDQFFRDLVTWFNLAWVDPGYVDRTPTLSALAERGGDFTPADTEAVLDAHRAIARAVLPAYRALRDRGQVELSTTPYYHPILPLLIDVAGAHEVSPTIALPATRFANPEDALDQLRLARQSHRAAFGDFPAGLWPSEGALSDATIDLLAGLSGAPAWRWVASDEAILARSVGKPIERDGDETLVDPAILYQPYRRGDASPAMFFRDRDLSDRIGFAYRGMSAEAAVDDLLQRLRESRERIGDVEYVPIVTIALDGENCWEEYERNGTPFLRELYGRLSEAEDIRSVTFEQHLAMESSFGRIERVAAGSWIYGNLETWIGEPMQNRAWEYLAEARAMMRAVKDTLPPVDEDVIERAWRELYIAEGSDWFWWYYSHNRHGLATDFDREFRAHLRAMYSLIGQAGPSWLDVPISGEPPPAFTHPTRHVRPRLVAQIPLPEEWDGAGHADAARVGGAMQVGGGFIRRLYVGNDPATLYCRLEAYVDLAHYEVSATLVGTTLVRAVIVPGTPESSRLFRLDGNGAVTADLGTPRVGAYGTVVEWAIPLALLDAPPARDVTLRVEVEREGAIVASLPESGNGDGLLRFALLHDGPLRC
ncbi:MAG: hypothetical protein EPO26_12785 [Chloroflexota bacterium]|nr:MAG: hypothetical protein EPO26_12785 [Chloroflexota bacterium]